MFNSGGSLQTFGFWQQLFFTVWNCFLGYRLGYRFIEFDVEEGEHTAYIRQFIYKEYIPIDTRKMIAKAVTWKFWEVSHFIFFCLILSWTGFKIQNCEKLSLVSEIAADLNFVRIIDKDIVLIIFVFCSLACWMEYPVILSLIISSRKAGLTLLSFEYSSLVLLMIHIIVIEMLFT